MLRFNFDEKLKIPMRLLCSDGEVQACKFLDALTNFISLRNSMNGAALFDSISSMLNRIWLNLEFTKQGISMWKFSIQRDWSLFISQPAKHGFELQSYFCTYCTCTYNEKMFNFIHQFSPFSSPPPSFKDWVFNDLTHQVPDSTTLTGTRARKDWQVSWKWSRAIFYIYLDNRVESKSSLVLALPFESFSKSKAAAWTWAMEEKANELVSRIFYGLSLKLSTSAIILRFLSGRLLSFT